MAVTQDPQVTLPADGENVLGNGVHTSPPDVDRNTRLTPGRRARVIVTELGPPREGDERPVDEKPAAPETLPEDPLRRGLERGRRMGALIHRNAGAPPAGIAEDDDLDTVLGASRTFAARQKERRERAAEYAKELHVGWLGPFMNFTDLLPALVNVLFRSGQWWTDRQGRFWGTFVTGGLLLLGLLIVHVARH